MFKKEKLSEYLDWLVGYFETLFITSFMLLPLVLFVPITWQYYLMFASFVWFIYWFNVIIFLYK